MGIIKGGKGFTLIELLVVLAILGVLAAIVVPTVVVFMGEGEEEGGSTELKHVQLAVAAAMTVAGSNELKGPAVNDTTTWYNDFRPGLVLSGSCVVYAESKTGTVVCLNKFLSPKYYKTAYWYQFRDTGRVLGAYEPDGDPRIGE